MRLRSIRRVPRVDADALARAAYSAQINGTPPPPTVSSATLLETSSRLRPVPSISAQETTSALRADVRPGGRRRPPTKGAMQRRTWPVIAFITLICRPWAPTGIARSQWLSIVIWLGFVAWTLVAPTIYFWSKAGPQGPVGAVWWLLTGSSERQPMGYQGAKVAVIGLSFFPIHVAVVMAAGLHGLHANDVSIAIVAAIALGYGLRPARLRAFRNRWRGDRTSQPSATGRPS